MPPLARAPNRNRERSWLLLALVVGGVTALAAPTAFFAMFSGFQDYDDEGYLLISLRDYARGGALYNDVYSQYGPAYYQLLAALFRLLGLAFTHTHGRAFVIVLWLSTAAVCAVATYRLTRNVAVALCSQLVVFQALVPLRNEPLHPSGVLSLILSAIVLAGSFLVGAHARAAAAAIGGLLATAILMKINVGAFALVSAVFALLAAGPRAHHRSVIRCVATAAFLLVAPTLMGPTVGSGPVRVFLVVVICSSLAVTLVQLSGPAGGTGTLPSLRVLAISLVVTGAVSCSWELWRGTTLAGLFNGILLHPSRHPGSFLKAPGLDPAAPWRALVCLALSVLFVLARNRGLTDRPSFAALHGPAQILAGAAIWIVAMHRSSLSPLAVSPPLLWIALTTPRSELDPARAFAQSFLVATAVLQSLHAYPVAMSQVAFATFLCVPVGAVAIADGWRTTMAALARSIALPRLRTMAVGALLAMAMIALTASGMYAMQSQYQATYSTGVPFDLPGTELIRVPPTQAALYQRLTHSLLTHCSTFVTQPGFNSLYLFTRLEPPTRMNTTAWMLILDDDQQAKIMDRLSHVATPVCAVRRQRLTHPWHTPLARYIDQHFVTVYMTEYFEFMVQRPKGPLSEQTPDAHVNLSSPTGGRALRERGESARP